MDWHHTCKNHASAAKRRCLTMLEDAGDDSFLCSYSGPDRQKETDFLSDVVFDGWSGLFLLQAMGQGR